jgi:sugar lactone lactonase YvrE
MKPIQASALKCAFQSSAIVGESPLWSALENRLYWIDIQGKKIHRFNPEAETNETFDLPEIVTSIALTRSGGLILTLTKNFAFFDPLHRKLTIKEEVETGESKNRFNDGKCDPEGRFFAGTMDSKNWENPSGHLFRYDPDGTVTTVKSEVICSNGTGWSPDGKTMYHTESFRYAIFAYDFERTSGTLSNRRQFFSVDRNSGGFPDGMSVDSEGFVWSNIVGKGEILRIDPKGRVQTKIKLPVSRATDCTFGGPDLKTLYITSARETLTQQQLQAEPLAGSLFSVETNVQGLPTTPFSSSSESARP